MSDSTVAGSFRDPSGRLFFNNGILLRQVNQSYKHHFDTLLSSGLYDELVKRGLMVPHTEADISLRLSDDAFQVIKPEPIEFISYPYEWCFSQLKDAALTVLEIQKESLNHGMTLKDCSAYNMQFHEGRAVLIDTLSFEIYDGKQPWSGYKQFCQHFLAPLALMSSTDVRLQQLSRIYMDGVPLDLTCELLPLKARFNANLLLHIYMHAGSQKRYSEKVSNKKSTAGTFSKNSFLGLIDSLDSCIRSLKWQPRKSDWYGYYSDEVLCSSEYVEHKTKLVSEMLDKIRPAKVFDLGANTGLFSRIACTKGAFTLSIDSDAACVEANYLQARETSETKLLPLINDLTNPSPAIGWENEERMTMWERGRADLVLALAMIHHLAISNNLPMDKIASFFSKICRSLIIEFVPKEDPNVQKLLRSRADIFTRYTVQEFEQRFDQFFTLKQAERIEGSCRTLYLMTRKGES